MTEILNSVWYNILGAIITVVSLGLAIYQTIGMNREKGKSRKLEELNKEIIKSNENKSAERCKRVFRYVRTLSNDLGIACQIVNSECLNNKNETGLCGRAAAAVNSAWTSNLDLIDFCNVLNQAHKEQYGHLADNKLSIKNLKELACVKGH